MVDRVGAGWIWMDEDKARIVAECAAPGASVSLVHAATT
jgi:transposase-like protein